MAMPKVICNDIKDLECGRPMASPSKRDNKNEAACNKNHNLVESIINLSVLISS